ncbi:tetratricopeptide repeat protein [Arcticibacterium luteifluviistationis]|uniref:Uncharacterized protein n=1 Tax=Arcticibacterium luteifluviistationis TaxID=1784714 RepID=A0A2Z4GEZ4_9BACT|nr:tetratricopeptide repeat protein [Arcticibacterium luteifluviistationis]AWV99932.1 hypothetical protein DJ013_17845 [Arcticibacterium luteifluviistationis]
MNIEFNDNFDEVGDKGISQTAKEFEAMVLNDESHYLNEDTYESLSEFYIEKSDWVLAKKACQLGLDQYPYSLELLLNRTQLHVNELEYEEGLELLDKAATFFPADTEILYMKGVINNLMGEHQTALELLERALLLSDQKDDIHFHLAQTFQNSGEFQKAAFHYKEAIKLGYDNEIAYLELIYNLEYLNKLEGSIPYFKNLTDEKPYSHYAWYCLGLAYSRLKDYPEAIRAFDFSVVIKEDFASGWFNLGHNYMNEENYEKAKEAYEKTLALEKPSAEVLTYLASSLEKLGDFLGAFNNYKKAAEIEENWEEAWYGMASVLFEQQKWMEAIHFAKKATKINETNSDYWLLQGDIEAQLGNMISSIEAYNQAANLDPENIDIWLNWSLLYFEKKDYQKAFEIIYNAIEEVPDEADLYYRATVYLVYDGTYNEAYKYLQDGLTLDFDAHEQIYPFFPNLKTQKALFRIIEQYK